MPSPGETREMADVIRRKTEDSAHVSKSGLDSLLLKSGGRIKIEGAEHCVPVDAS